MDTNKSAMPRYSNIWFGNHLFLEMMDIVEGFATRLEVKMTNKIKYWVFNNLLYI